MLTRHDTYTVYVDYVDFFLCGFGWNLMWLDILTSPYSVLFPHFGYFFINMHNMGIIVYTTL